MLYTMLYIAYIMVLVHSRQLNIRIDDVVYTHLVTLSEKRNQSMAEVIRNLIISESKKSNGQTTQLADPTDTKGDWAI